MLTDLNSDKLVLLTRFPTEDTSINLLESSYSSSRTDNTLTNLLPLTDEAIFIPNTEKFLTEGIFITDSLNTYPFSVNSSILSLEFNT